MLRFFYLSVALVAIVLILVLLRSRKLKEKYAALWIMVGLAIVLLATVPSLLFSVSDLLGFEAPSNLLFVLAIFLLLGVALHLSLEISRLEDETRILAENVAILNLVVTEAGLTDRLSQGPTAPGAAPGASPRSLPPAGHSAAPGAAPGTAPPAESSQE